MNDKHALLYRKLTVDWPCAVSDWLWWACVFVPADFLNRLTVKRAFFVLGTIFFVLATWQVLGAVDALLFSADVLLYLDVTTAVLLLAVREQVSAIGYTVQRVSLQSVKTLMARSVAAYRFCARQTGRLKTIGKSTGRDAKDGEPDGAFWVWQYA